MDNSQKALHDLKEQFQKSEAWFQMQLDLAVDAILLGSNKGIIINANKQVSSLTGFSYDELVGQNIEFLFSEEEQKRVPLRYDLLKEGKIVRFDRFLTRKDSSNVPIEMNTKMMPDGTYQTFIRDITERRNIEETLRKSEEKFSKAFNTSPDSININRLSDGVYLEINRGFTAITGYTPEEVLGRSSLPGDLGIWINKADRDRLVEGIKANGEVIDLEAPFRKKDGEIIIGLMSARSVEINGETCLLSTTRDITEKLRLLETSQKNQKLESLGVLAGGIAHDFNNLLAGLYGYLDLARSVSTEPKVQHYLDATLPTLSRARGLTQQLLTFAKGGAPVQTIDSLKPVVQQSVQFGLSGSNVSCNFAFSQDLWLCNFDANQIAQVIDNLVINAVQAMPQGGRIDVSAKNISLLDKQHPVLQKGNYIAVAIQDCGVGIPKNIISRIFDPYFTTKSKGHGLGLATCYSIIHRHSGIIEVESQPGNGSTFTIYLPAVIARVEEPSQAPVTNHRGSGTILVMDDEEVIRNSVGLMLRALGYSAVLASDGNAVLDYFVNPKNHTASLTAIILDLTVPGKMGGKETIEKIRQINGEVPVFVASGYADDAIMANPTQYGFTASICKPFTSSELSEMLEKYLSFGR